VCSTYKDFKDIDLVDEGCVVFDFLLLNGLDRKLLMALPVFGQVYNAEAAVGQLLLERVDIFDVALR
jgi:hypothetical protein